MSRWDEELGFEKSEALVETNASYRKTYSFIPLLLVFYTFVAFLPPKEKKKKERKKNLITVRNSHWKYLEVFTALANITDVQDKHLKESV